MQRAYLLKYSSPPHALAQIVDVRHMVAAMPAIQRDSFFECQLTHLWMPELPLKVGIAHGTQYRYPARMQVIEQRERHLDWHLHVGGLGPQLLVVRLDVRRVFGQR